MGAAWVAGVTRARSMLVRRLGITGARHIAAAEDLEDALRGLATTPYCRHLASGASLPTAQRAVTAALLWHLRVLAGWLPRRGVECLRLLASGFEIANIETHFHRLFGSGEVPPPYVLGALATVWGRLAGTSEPEALRAALIASPWRDPGSTPAAMAVTLRLTAAARIAARIPPAVRWSAGRAALLVARERFVHDRPLPATAHGPAAAEYSAALVRLLLGARPADVAPLLGAPLWTVVHAERRRDTTESAASLAAALGTSLVAPGTAAEAPAAPGVRPATEATPRTDAATAPGVTPALRALVPAGQEITARMRADTDLKPGQVAHFAFNMDKAVLFDPKTSNRIG